MAQPALPEPEPAPVAETVALVEAEPEVAAPLAPVDARVVAAKPTGQRWALPVAWVSSVAVLAAALWLGYAARDAVMHAWPASVRAYAALGLARH